MSEDISELVKRVEKLEEKQKIMKSAFDDFNYKFVESAGKFQEISAKTSEYSRILTELSTKLKDKLYGI
jgi:hypothetical protein